MTLFTTCEQSNHSDDETQIDFGNIQKLTAADTKLVDEIIINELSSDVALINQIGKYIVSSGGKRLRPMLLLLSSKALGYKGREHLSLAAVIEFIHTATLLHDDVVDESDLRRGQETVNTVWGNAPSVLVGDYLLSRAFELMVRVDKMRVMELLSHTTTAIAEGEVLQLLNINNPATTEEKYLNVVSRKTAILFGAASQLGGVLADAPENIELAFRNYGLHLGIAFQIIDDVLDYKADPEETGKNVGDDLADGKPTLPLIYAMQKSSTSDGNVIKKAIESSDREAFREVLKIVEATDSIAYTERRAQEEAQRAIEALNIAPESEYKESMIQLAEFSVQRHY